MVTMKRKANTQWRDLAPYAGRWVALVCGRVVGVGWTAGEAHQAAKRSRPKEEPQVVFVPAVEELDDDVLLT